jgi:hypothetical protein
LLRKIIFGEKMHRISRFAVGFLFVTALAVPGRANFLLGTQVTGDMNIGGTNYFDWNNGFVPAGYGNSQPGSTTVTIADPLIEFGYQDGSNTNTVDFTDTGFTLTDVSVEGSDPFPYTFVNDAFLGASIAQVSNTFPNLSATLVGNTITLDFEGLPSPGTYTATFSLTATPEPQSVFLVGSALALLAFATRKRWITN